MTPLSLTEGVTEPRSRPLKLSASRSCEHCANAHVTPKCPRVPPVCVTDNLNVAKMAVCRNFAKPSSGLEPETPPYHGLLAANGRNPRQRFWA
jgi:hypothetical protein